MIHIVLDNGVHDSTGGQATASAAIDFTGVALACNYRHAISCDSFDRALTEALEAGGPTLVHARIPRQTRLHLRGPWRTAGQKHRPAGARICAQRIEFRIGVNLGDVIVEEHDIFGDGVNVAAVKPPPSCQH
jgi:hypothetical protein